MLNLLFMCITFVCIVRMMVVIPAILSGERLALYIPKHDSMMSEVIPDILRAEALANLHAKDFRLRVFGGMTLVF